VSALPATRLEERIRAVFPEEAGPVSLARPNIISATDLLAKVFPEPKWAVEPLFPEGIAVLAGAPKLGKSWLALGLAIAIASGGRAIGQLPVKQGSVLYLALEDTQRRLQSRIATLLPDHVDVSALQLVTDWPAIGDGGTEHMVQWLSERPDCRLVIIDTLARIRGPVSGLQNQYSADYEAMSRLKRVADEFGVAVLIVHHTRKAAAEDPLDMVSGTNAIAGAADTILVLKREIGKHDAVLHVRGRDVPESDHALAFDQSTCTWNLLGDADTYRLSQERQAIVNLLRDASEPMRPKTIAEALGKKDGAVRKLLYSMSQAGTIVGHGGSYSVPPKPAPDADGWEVV
jgi:hypothetical protein